VRNDKVPMRIKAMMPIQRVAVVGERWSKKEEKLFVRSY
jgi:hypothetical protein